MASGRNPFLFMSLGKQVSSGSLTLSRFSATLITISHAVTALTHTSLSGLAIALRAIGPRFPLISNHQSNTWVSSSNLIPAFQRHGRSPAEGAHRSLYRFERALSTLPVAGDSRAGRTQQGGQAACRLSRSRSPRLQRPFPPDSISLSWLRECLRISY